MRVKNRIMLYPRAAALLLCLSLTACRSVPPAADDENPPAVTSVCGTEAPESEVTSEKITAPADTGPTEAPPESAALPDVTEDTAESGNEDTVTETDAVSSEEPSVSTGAAPDSQETTPPVTAAQPDTQKTTAGTTVTEPPKPPAEIVIPEVKKASSPGTSVFSADNAEIDYSNASSGYISAKYTGSKARAKLRIVKGSQKYDHDLSVGGTVEYFPLSQGSGDYQIQLFEQADGKMYSSVIDEKLSVKITDEVSMYLYPNKYVNFSQRSNAVKKSAEVCAGKNGTIDKLAAIFVYITSNITYDKQLAATVQSGYVPDPDSVLSKKKGICFDYASLFAAMSRAQGIPTRLVVGYASPDIYHAWNEVYTKETGWITVELFLKNNGYNLLDATFYAGAVDKEKIADYISDTKNYSPLYLY